MDTVKTQHLRVRCIRGVGKVNHFYFLCRQIILWRRNLDIRLSSILLTFNQIIYLINITTQIVGTNQALPLSYRDLAFSDLGLD